MPILILLAFALALPAQAPAAVKSIWGPTTLPGGSSAFPVYRQLGAKDIQLVLNWASVSQTRPADPANPADPAYAWPATIDEALAGARANGMTVSVELTHTAAWANGGKGELYAPDNPRDFAGFAAAASRRYPGVKRWMIWGEPNRPEQFLPIPRNRPDAPRRYALILDAAYAALKKVSARDQVVGGMTFTAGGVLPATWLRYMKLPNGKPPRLDLYGHNPFSTRFPDLAGKPVFGNNRDFDDLDTFSDEVHRAYRNADRRFKRSGPKLWLSEFTIQSDRSSPEFAQFTSRTNQAQWLRAAYRIADRQIPAAGMGWIGLVDSPGPTGTRLGLMTTALERKPAFDAFRNAPSVRHTPTISVAESIASRRLGTRGLGVRVRPKTGGRITIELRRRGRRVLLARTDGAQRAQTVRLRSARRSRGTYQLLVRSPRGVTFGRPLSADRRKSCRGRGGVMSTPSNRGGDGTHAHRDRSQ